MSDQANAAVRQQAAILQSEADDLMRATLAIEGEPEAERASAKSKNVNLTRVTVTGQMNVVKTKLDEAITTIRDSMLDTTAKLASVDEAVKEAVKTSGDELSAKGEAAKIAVLETMQNITGMIAQLPGCVSSEQLTGLKRQADQMSKEVYKDQVTPFNRALASFKKCIDTQARSNRSQAQQEQPQQQQAPHPLVTILKNINKDEPKEASTSIFEAKGGVRMCVLEPSKGELLGKLQAFPKLKRCDKNMTSHLLNSKTGVADITEPPVTKKLTKELKGSFDASLFTQVVLPKETAWTSKVYGYQFFGFGENALNINASHMCLMECRLLFKGSMLILGVPYETVPGATFKEKRNHIFQSNHQQMKQMCQAAGTFLHLQIAGQLAVLPTGYLFTLLAADGPCCGLRWSLSSDTQCQNRTLLMMDQLIESHPEMANPSTGYVQFKDWLVS